MHRRTFVAALAFVAMLAAPALPDAAIGTVRRLAAIVRAREVVRPASEPPASSKLRCRVVVRARASNAERPAARDTGRRPRGRPRKDAPRDD